MKFEMYIIIFQLVFLFILSILCFWKRRWIKKIITTIFLIWIITLTVNYVCAKKNITPIFTIIDHSTPIGVHKCFGLGYEFLIKDTFYNDNDNGKMITLSNFYLGPILINSDNILYELEEESLSDYLINKNDSRFIVK